MLDALLIKTVCEAEDATNEYHTSSLAPVPLQEGAASADGVDPVVAPATELEHVFVDEGAGSKIAPVHSSLAGAAVIQMSNVPKVVAVVEVEYTRT